MFSRMPYEETHQSEANTGEPPRFPLALKRARLAKQWKQEALAAHMHVKVRTLVSWETGTRLPSVGMVILLSLLLTDDLDLSNDLVRAYIADDLIRQALSQHEKDFRALALGTLERVSRLQKRGDEQEQEGEPPLSLFGKQAREDRQEYHLEQQRVWQQEPHDQVTTGGSLQQLFAVLETLRTHPELIPVVQDFLREVATES